MLLCHRALGIHIHGHACVGAHTHTPLAGFSVKFAAHAVMKRGTLGTERLLGVQ